MVLAVPDFGLTHAPLGSLPVGWRQFGEQADTVEAQLESDTGSEPLLVGMDRYFLSSEIAFYDPDKDGAENTAGRSLFGMDSLMFRFWFKPAEVRGRNIILFSLRPKGAIAAKSLSDQFKTLGPIQNHLVFKDGNRWGIFSIASDMATGRISLRYLDTPQPCTSGQLLRLEQPHQFWSAWCQ